MAEQKAHDNGEWTINRLLAWTRQYFESHGIDEPRLSAELLLAKVLDCPKIQLYTRFNETPTNEQRTAFRELVKAAVEHHPIAYLVGRKEFYSLDFLVTSDVLIPRPETELLVEHALAWCDANQHEEYHLLDVGTGSGCIAVTMTKRNPVVLAVATDISEAALRVARQNAELHQVTKRIHWIQADLLNLPPDDVNANRLFDLILSNPPYVAEKDRESLPENVRRYEPSAALFSGDDGLDAYRRIAADIRRHLRPHGALLLEIGIDQANDVEALFATAGLELVARHKDLAGIERALQFTLPA
ncbi:MAG: peptide chain release factor N(5)-glutamine methyltransferase [Phycisphaerales bacterium]|nr:peptide chain release factor N(5)-glutamine methyltransferase [Phycisphaerales bacterium]